MKKPLLLLFFLCLLLPASAQRIQWAQHGGGTEDDVINDMAFDKAGNSYVAGFNNGSVAFNDINLSEGGMLLKYNPAGKPVWGKAFRSGGNVAGRSFFGDVLGVSVDQFNNVYITGYFAGELTVDGITITSRGPYDAYFAKFDPEGKVLWLKGFGGPGEDVGADIFVDQFQNIHITGRNSLNTYFDNTLVPDSPGMWEHNSFYAKFNADGSFNFVRRLPSHSMGWDVEVDAAGNAFIAGKFQGILNLSEYGLETKNAQNNTGIFMFLTKFNRHGQLQWITTSNTANASIAMDTRLDGIVLDGLGNCYMQGAYSDLLEFKHSSLPREGGTTTFLAKFDTRNGQDLWLKKSELTNYYGFKTIAADSLGNIYLGGAAVDGRLAGKPVNYGSNKLIVARFNALGNPDWVQGISASEWSYFTALVLSKTGRIGVAGRFSGSYAIPGINQGNSHVSVRTSSFSFDVLTAVLDDTIAALKPNRISGIIFEDKNNNCIRDLAEQGVQGLLVKADPGPYFALTDSAGAFSLSVDTGSYVISQVIPKSKINFFESCPDADLVKAAFKGYGQQLNNVSSGVQIKACTQLTVDIAADRRRRCMRGKTTVTYSNQGTADAQNVRIKVLYPRYVVPLKSSLAWASRQDSVMVFDIGMLKAGERRSFVITDSTVCGNEAIRGLSQCVKAIISPKNTCLSPGSEWDKSSVAVEASLTEQDQVASFTIANEGQGDMGDSTVYRLYANEALARQGKVKLAKGARARLAVPNPRATLRLEADQSAHHPGMSRPVASLQPVMVSPAMAAPSPVDAAYQDDADAEVSISCLPIIDSFDPNDKQVSPQGISRRHYIKAEDELEYQIRFQNTGTDTAYTVVVKDTLSSYVDVASLQIGSASHPFTYTVSGKGRPVLTFTFKNINLPDHKKNEPASHGYVRFRITQVPGNPKGTVIRNLAYNYFDFNSPIATNEIFNMIGDTIMAPPEPVLVYDCGKQMPTVALAGEEIRLCEASETVLQANAPVHGIGRWRILNGQATLSDPASPQSRLTAIGYGEVVLEWRISLCEVVSRSQVKVIRSAIPAAPELSVPALQCEGSQPQPLRATGSNITWYADADKQQKLYAGNGFIPQIQATTTFYASQTVNGCESPAASVEVKVHPAELSFAVHHDTLVAPQADAYQWYFNGQAIEGATGQKFFARNTGSYRLQSITQGCVRSSSPVAIAKNQPQATLTLGPNPASGRLHLELTANQTGELRILIRDRLGRELRSFKVSKPHTVLEQTLELGNISSGLYLVEIQLGGQVLTRKFVQQ